MLTELHVSGLGVISDATLEFGTGFTALTGETGAGKTLVVDALALVMGGRPNRGLVPLNGTALIEARFVTDAGDEVILAREIPSEGRARAWIDGRMASVAALAEQAVGLCDIHGQHEHQSLLAPGAIRSALDAFGSIDVTDLKAARQRRRDLEVEAASLGGTPEEIERERALLDYQLAEIRAARIENPGEIEELLERVRLLEGSDSLQATMEVALDWLGASGSGARDVVGELRASLDGFGSFSSLRLSLQELETLLDDVAQELRSNLDGIDSHPEALQAANDRLSVLHQLCRRYGPTLDEVLANEKAYQEQLDLLNDAESARASITIRLDQARRELDHQEATVEAARVAAAPTLESTILANLSSLALERARVELSISGAAGDNVTLLFSANPGLPLAPVGSVASGGELSRLMLALRLSLPGGPPTMVFDEVDAGVGGVTAVALAEALRAVAQHRQVIVVTHLAQVAALADAQVSVEKTVDAQRTSASATALDDEARVREIARMLSGQPDSPAALEHARDLLGG
jgi:DNA repair protein RecN (Recombination protein N)